jgi:hypothetical protein
MCSSCSSIGGNVAMGYHLVLLKIGLYRWMGYRAGTPGCMEALVHGDWMRP